MKSKKKRPADVISLGSLSAGRGAPRTLLYRPVVLMVTTIWEEARPVLPCGRPQTPLGRGPGTRKRDRRRRRGLQLPGCRARERLRSAAGGGGLFSAEEERGRGGRQRVRVQSSAAAARAHDSHMPCSFFHLW